MQVGGTEPDRIGAEAEERGLGEIDLAAEAEHDGKPEHRDRERGRLHQDVEDIAVEPQRGRERDQHGRADEIRQVPNESRPRAQDGCRYRHVVASGRHAFSATRSPKMPCGRKIRNATSTRKAKAVLVRHRDVCRAERLDDAEREPADDRAGDIAKAADDGGGKGLQRDGRAHLDRDEQDRRDQNAGEAAEHRGVDEGDHDHGGDGNAEQRGHLLVLRGRLQLLAEQGVLEEPVVEDDQRDRDRDDQEILAVEIDGPELDARRLEPALQHLRLRAIDREHRIREQDRGADGRDDDRKVAAMTQGIVDAKIEDDAEQRHAGEREQERQPVGPAEIDRNTTIR